MTVAIVAEPYLIPTHPCWLVDEDNLVAITWQLYIGPFHCAPLSRGHGYVLVEYGDMVVVGCYISPAATVEELEKYLDEVQAHLLLYRSRPCIVAGDFNCKATQWGSAVTTAKGAILVDWVATQNLWVLNRGTVSTCVRWQGESIVDVMFDSPVIVRRLRRWYVADHIETLSDHNYILMELTATASTGVQQSHISSSILLRWSIKRLDTDLLTEAASFQGLTDLPGHLQSVEEMACWLRQHIRRLCDLTMPHVKRTLQRSVFWWSPELARLRGLSVKQSRKFTRARKRGIVGDELKHLYDLRKSARREYKIAIRKAKARAWDQLLEMVDGNPWGKPYRNWTYETGGTTTH